MAWCWNYDLWAKANCSYDQARGLSAGARKIQALGQFGLPVDYTNADKMREENLGRKCDGRMFTLSPETSGMGSGWRISLAERGSVTRSNVRNSKWSAFSRLH